MFRRLDALRLTIEMMRFLLTTLVVCVPVVITPKLLFHYDSLPKIALVALAAAIIAMRPRELARNISHLWQKPIGKAVCMAAAAQVAWSAIATLGSSRVLFSLLGSNWRRLGFLTVLALAILVVSAAGHLSRHPEDARYLLRASATAAIFVSLYTIAQYFGIDPVQNGAAYHAQDGDFTIVRPPATLGHADYLGWWLAITIFCCWELWRIESGWWRITGNIALVLSAIATVFTGTRSAIIAVAAGLIYLMATGNVKLSRRRWIPVAGIALLAVLFVISPAGNALRARVKWASDEVPGGGRPLLWRDSLRMALIHPLTGFGPETFAAEFPRYQSEDLSRIMPDFYHESPHNVALDTLISEGLPGLLIAIAWLAIGVVLVRRKIPGLPVSAGLNAALIASLAASLFNSLTIGPAIATAMVLAMLAGRQSEGTTGEQAPVPHRGRTAFFGAGIPAGAALAGFAVLLVYSDYKLEKFERVSGGHDAQAAMAALQEIPKFQYAPAEDLYVSRRLASVCSSGNAANHLMCSIAALQTAARAIRTADNPPNAWYNLALFAAAQNDVRGAEEAMRTTIQIAPNWFRPHRALANFLAVSGRAEEAKTQMQRAAWLEGSKTTTHTLALDTRAQAR